MRKIKVAIAQINYRPAFYKGEIDMIIEPYDDTSISQLSYNGSTKIKQDLRRDYLSWIKNKIIAITKCAVDLCVDLLVFPEYSIPPEILCDMIEVIKDSNLFVVAGTHIVTSKNIKLPANYPNVKSIIGFAMCPILYKYGVYDHTFKTHKAQPEICSLKIPKEKTKEIINLGEFKIQIKICIDAIYGGEIFCFNKENKGILVIPSLSYSVDPFNAVAIYSRFNEIPVLYSNISEIGGSVISASFTKADKHWFVDSMKSKPLYKDVEAVVTATFNLDKMFISNGTVNSEAGAEINEVISIFYSKDEQHKQTINSIDKYINGLNYSDFTILNNASNSSLMATKLRYVEQMQQNGLMDSDSVKNIFEYIKINDVSYKEIQLRQCQKVLNSLTASWQFINDDDKIIPNLHTLLDHSEKNNSQIGISQNNESIFNDEKLFYGRDLEIAKLSEFLHSPDNVMLIHGLRGIGKTKLVKNIETQIIPLKTLWDVNYIQLTQGVGLEFLFDELSNVIDLPYFDIKKVSIDVLIDSLFEIINKGKEQILILDDIHHCTEPNGSFVDLGLGEFICRFISEAKRNQKMKLILVSNRKIPDIECIINQKLEISRLANHFVANIIHYCYQKISGTLAPITIDNKVYEIIYGNPLAAILISQLLIENKWDKFEEATEVFNHFQEGLIKRLLDEITLSDDEVKLLKIISVTKGKLDVKFVNLKFPYLLSSVESLLNRFLLDLDDGFIIIHPLFKEHFYYLLDLTSRTKYHKEFADYYENQYEEEKSKKHIDPNILSNVVYHVGGSLQYNKFSYYKNKYIEELKPIADTLYREKDHKGAVLYYRKIYDTSGINRTDILIKMAQCYVYENNLPEAEKFFELAHQPKPRSAYLWAEYAIALTSLKTNVTRALECVKEAYEIVSKYDNAYDWELAKIKFAEARAYRYINVEKASELFLQVCDIEKTNTYYLCVCSEFLYRHGDKKLAIEKLLLAEKIDSKYHYVIRLKENFKINIPHKAFEVQETSENDLKTDSETDANTQEIQMFR